VPDSKEDLTSITYSYYRKSSLWKTTITTSCALYLFASLLENPLFQQGGGGGGGGEGGREKTREQAVMATFLLELVCNLIFFMDTYVGGKSQGWGVVVKDWWARVFLVIVVFDSVGLVW